MKVACYFKNFVYLLTAYAFIFVFATYFINKTKEINYNFASVEDFHSKPNHVIKTLILDSKFNEIEIGFIEMACKEWEIKTNRVVEFKIVMDFDLAFVNEDTVYINKSNKNNPIIFALELTPGTIIYGYYDKKSLIKSILIVADNINDIVYYQVALHELGHALGLKHNTDNSDDGTIMYPAITSKQIGLAKKDLDQFCKIYKCSSE